MYSWISFYDYKTDQIVIVVNAIQKKLKMVFGDKNDNKEIIKKYEKTF